MALVTLVAGGALAACGSASSASSTTSSTTASASASASGSGSGAAGTGANSARRAQLASCLKAHGVTLPTPPAGGFRPPAGGSSSGSTSTTGTGTSTTPRRGFFFGGGGANVTPKMRAAFQACGARFGFGGGGGAFRGRISHTAINNFVGCVKKNGYSQMPAPNFSGKGPIFPRSVESNAKFQAASRACSHLLVPARPSGGSSGGTSTTSGA